MKKIILIIIITLFTAGGAVLFMTKNTDLQIETLTNTNTGKAVKPVVFTHGIFDLNEVKNITPIGELNGGYWEFQSFAGVMMNLKVDSNREAGMTNIYAPKDMSLVSYSYHDIPGSNDPTWALTFELTPGVTMTMHHVQEAGEKITKATTTVPADNSREIYLETPLRFEAGEYMARTAGTPQAHNWNIYVYDENLKNQFVRQERYEQDSLGQEMLTATCVFDFYPENMREPYKALYGYTEPGQSETCGTVSRDVKGSIAGLWYFTEDPIEGIIQEKEGVYAGPLAVYKASDDTIVLHEINDGGHEIYPETNSYKDPSEITGEHCYALTDNYYFKPAGYAYFKVIDDYTMKLSYSSDGSCPDSFPASNARTYYR